LYSHHRHTALQMSLHSFPITTAELTGTFVQSVLFGQSQSLSQPTEINKLHGPILGVCLVFLSGVIKIHFSCKKIAEGHLPNLFIMFTIIAMAIIAILDVSLGFYHMLLAFVDFKGLGGALEELSNFGFWIDVVRSTDYALQILLGDVMLVIFFFTSLIL
jgi:hypothetical protein